MKKISGPPEKPKLERKLLADALKKVEEKSEGGPPTILDLKARVYDLSRLKTQIEQEMNATNQQIAQLERQRAQEAEREKKKLEQKKGEPNGSV